MAMPIDLVLVRHGQAEGNVARSASEAGDDGLFTEEFCKRHSSKQRLTKRGRAQAALTGAWIRSEIGGRFDRYIVSGYVRAMETAALLDLSVARWYQDFYLRERDIGDFDTISETEKAKRFPSSYAQYKRDPFYWTPPNGESLAQLCMRIDRVLSTLHRECSDKRVIIVCHGLVMWAFRIRIERWTSTDFLRESTSPDPAHRINNCQVIRYTRHVYPQTKSGELSPRCMYIRSQSQCPSMLGEPDTGWLEIHRPAFRNEDLLRLAEAAPRLID
jgi:NAD+ kinase